MNIDTLMKELYDSLIESGWLDKATKYFQEHPEKFNDCVIGDGKIAVLSMSISYITKSLLDVPSVKPSVFISVGDIAIEHREFNVYNTGTVQSSTWINGEKVVEVKNRV